MTTTQQLINWKRFVDHSNDMDTAIFVREFSGRITARRWKIISSFCRKHCWRVRCGHEYDCCGCLFAQDVNFTYKQNQVVITITQHFNY